MKKKEGYFWALVNILAEKQNKLNTFPSFWNILFGKEN